MYNGCFMKTLQKQQNKDFVILNLTDTQMSEGAAFDDDDNVKTILEHTIKQLVERVKPDLIAISGDLGYGWQPKAYTVFGKFMDSFGIPWTFVWGNHDNEGGAEAIENIANEYLQYEHCLFEKGDKNLGSGNYVVTISENDQIVHGLIFMDTHDRIPYQNPDGTTTEVFAKLTPQQLEWYKQQVEHLQSLGCDETTLILHIPIYAYKLAIDEAYKPDLDKKQITVEQSYGGDCWNKGYEQSAGVCYEGVCCYPQDDGVFDLIQKFGSTKTVICGHDHINNAIINYKGVKLVYALKTGRGCYWHKDLNGGTVIKIADNGTTQVYHDYVDIK